MLSFICGMPYWITVCGWKDNFHSNYQKNVCSLYISEKIYIYFIKYLMDEVKQQVSGISLWNVTLGFAVQTNISKM